MIQGQKGLRDYRYYFLAVAWAVLGWIFIYTHDDFAWGSMQYIFPSDVNGRYIGHLFSLTLTRSRILKMVVVSATMTGIVYCIERIFRKNYVYLVSVLSILLLPRVIFRQTIAWVSGFANYTTAVLFLLLFAVYVVEHTSGECNSKRYILLLAVLGMVNSLFVEHCTIFNVILGVLLAGYYIVHRQIRWDYLGYCIGSLLGALAMFSHPVYHVVLNQEDEYRAVASGGLLTRMKENYLAVIFQEGYFNNLFLNVLILAVCILLFHKKSKEGFKYLSLKVLVGLGLLVMCVFWCCTAFFLIKYGYAYANYFTGYQRSIVGAFTFFNLIITITCSLILSSSEGVDYFLMNLWASFIIIITPLFVVTPIGSRCFLGSYIILVMILCRLLSGISWYSVSITCKYAEMLAVVALGFLFIRYFYIYGGYSA